MNDSFETQRFERISAPDPIQAGYHGSSGAGAPTGGHVKASGGTRFKQQPDPHKGRKRLFMALAIIGGFAALSYAGGAIIFRKVFYPNTSIVGVDVSFATLDQAVDRAENALEGYSLTIKGNDFLFEFTPDSGNPPVDIEQVAHTVLDANDSLAWPIRLAQSLSMPLDGEDAKADKGTEVTLSSGFDWNEFQSKLKQAAEEYNAGRTGVFDAPSAYDESLGAFTLERAKSNVKVDVEQVTTDAKVALSRLDPVLELDHDDFESLANDPTEAELEAACNAANELLGVSINLTMAGKTVGSLDGRQLASWIAFDDNLVPALDDKQLEPWIKELDKQLDTTGSERTYTRPDGKTITVGGGTYGWTTNSAELAALIKKAFVDKQTGDFEIPLKQKAAVFTAHGERDWAEYVDIDLTEQHARYYDASNNLVWESGCITGNPNLGNDTPTGIYRMNQCSKNVTLVGKKDPETGEPEYKTPVSYWMPFVGGAIGLHDASWQAAASFSNPNAYTWTGSHGCINLPPDKAGQLYEIVKPGICVIVHW